MIPIVIGALRTLLKVLEKGIEELKIRGRVEIIKNYNIVKIGQNTEKSSGDLRRLAATQSPEKDYQLTLVWKFCQDYYYYYYNYYYSLEFFTSALADGFSLELGDSKSSQVSRTRLRILAVLSNAVVWIVSTRLPTSKSSWPFNNPLVIVRKGQITIGTIVTFMFHKLFNSLARSKYLSFFSHSFRFILWSTGTAKSTILQILFSFFFFVDYYKVWSSGQY